MKCKKIEALLLEYLSDRLDPDLSAEIRSHIKDCENCKAMKEHFKKLLNMRDTMENVNVQDKDTLIRNIKDKYISKNCSYRLPILKYSYITTILIAVIITSYYVGKKGEKIIINDIKTPSVDLIKAPIKEVKPKLKKEKKINENSVEIKKLEEQTENIDVIFRGANVAKKKKFVEEWLGTTKATKESKHFIIGNKSGWNELWIKYIDKHAPEVDFKKYIALAFFSDYDEFRITDVKESKFAYLVTKNEIEINNDEETISGIPYHIITLKR